MLLAVGWLYYVIVSLVIIALVGVLIVVRKNQQ